MKAVSDKGGGFDIDIPATHPAAESTHQYPFERVTYRPVISTSDLAAYLKDSGHLAHFTGATIQKWTIRRFVDDGDGATEERWPIWDVLTGTFDFEGHSYVLDSGRVLRFDQRYVSAIDQRLGRVPGSRTQFPSLHPKTAESAWLKYVVDGSGGALLLLDQKLVRLQGQTPVEVCDLLSMDGVYVHVKRHWHSTGLSHLISQARASSELLFRDKVFRTEVSELVRQEGAGHFLLDVDGFLPSETEISLVIIGHLSGKSVAQRMPLLSRINFVAMVDDIEAMGYQVTLTVVEPDGTAAKPTV